MNYTHLNAILQAAFSVRCAEIDGIRVLSNGQIAFIHDAWLGRTVEDADNKLREYWSNMTRDSGESLAISELGVIGDHFVRLIGNKVIDEAYFRAIHEDGFQWFSVGDQLQVWKDRNRAAIVMGMRCHPEQFNPASPTDEQVFERFACEANDWYLQSEKAILVEIQSLEKRTDNLHERVESIEEEILANDEKIEELRTKMREKKTKLGAAQ